MAGLRWSRFNIVVPTEGTNGQKVLVFNTLTRNLITIKQAAFEAVQQSTRASTATDDPAVAQLKRLGILVEEDLDEIAYMKFCVNRWKYGSNTLGVFASFASQCNFRCIYCYQDFRPDSGQLLSRENWERLFRFLKKKVSASRVSVIGVVLFGGEPLLNPELINQAVLDLRTFEAIGVKVAITLITNGSLLEGMALGLGDHLDGIQVTLDGPKKVHDLRRPYSDNRGSYDDVRRNLEGAAERFPGKVSLRINVDDHTTEYVPELLRDLASRGMQRRIAGIDVVAEYSSQQDIARRGCESKVTQSVTERIAQTLLQAAKSGWKLHKKFVVGPCNFCCANSIATDEDLNVYRCPGFLYQQPDGYISKDADLQVSRSTWYEGVAFEPSCVDSCVYAPICYGGCRWMGGGPNKINCNKSNLDLTIKTLVEAYAISKYSQQISYSPERVSH